MECLFELKQLYEVLSRKYLGHCRKTVIDVFANIPTGQELHHRFLKGS